MQRQISQVSQFHEAFGVPIQPKPLIPSSERTQLRIKLLEEELQELKDAIAAQDLVEIADALTDLQYILIGSVLEFGLQDKFERFFDEVQRSNMSKLDAGGKPIYREDGKVMKSEQFTPPDLISIFND